jgi:ABC-type nitrate/sulfonate/bicarbonate transport system ATPase subunit
MGRSGSGKSTFLKLLAGVFPPTSGRIHPEPLKPLVSYLAQAPVSFDHLSPMQNATFFTRLASLRKHYDADLVGLLAKRFALSDVLAASDMASLSGGEKQRIALLRALSIHPNVLLLDEPCAGFDPTVKYEFLRLLRDVVEDQKVLALYVTHHPEEADLIADDCLLFERSGTQPTAVVSASIDNLRRHPSSAESLQNVTAEPVNVLCCSFRDRRFWFRDVVIGEIEEDHEPSVVRLAFCADAAVAAESGVPVEGCSHSGRYAVCRIIDEPALVITRHANDASHFVLRGPMVAFWPSQPHGTTVILK